MRGGARGRIRFTAPSLVPGTGASQPGVNGSRQGLLSRKLDANRAGSIAVVNSSFDAGNLSLIRLIRGRLQTVANR